MDVNFPDNCPYMPWPGPAPMPGQMPSHTPAPMPGQMPGQMPIGQIPGQMPTVAPVAPGTAPRRQPPIYYPPTGTLPTGTDVVPPGVPYEQGPPSTRDVGYIQAFLARNIGQHVKIEFVLGTNMYVDRSGTIVEVGTNYVVIIEDRTDDQLMCDLYAIKFVTIYK